MIAPGGRGGKMLAQRAARDGKANLALGVAAGHERISVDVHVDRVTVRWGSLR